ncbi:MAG TPA: Coq4 family protein [Minicystis sp.]|nr:Coq4 family protein [Minicystis sp.]
MTASLPRFDVPRAFSALRALAADPDDLPQVFTVLEALRGTTLARMRARLLATEQGRELLATKPDVVAKLADRDALRKLPAGSLGRAYLAFVESEGISAEGIRKADADGRTGGTVESDDEDWLHRRMRDTHDLWHAVTGYQGDVLGEAALLGFTLAQNWNIGVALIVGIGLAKTSGKPDARRLILEGYRRGQRAAWLPAVAWETLLATPLEDVRRTLSVGNPPVYTPVRSSELRAAA